VRFEPVHDPSPDRIVIQYPAPAVDGGRYPAKRCAGDRVVVGADIFRDGHELLRAVVRYRPAGARRWQEAELERSDAHLEGVRWSGGFEVDAIGRWEYTIEAWTDVFGTWRDELRRKLAAGQTDLKGELAEGEVLLQTAAKQAKAKGDRAVIELALNTLQADPATALDEDLFNIVERTQERHGRVTLEPPLVIEVDRTRARFGAWYELFPRSWGGLKGVERQLPKLAELGFDVIYLPPIHPIGHTNRKGANNALTAGPTTPARRGRSAMRAAATRRCTPIWARSRTSSPSRTPPKN
jgi:starch synthase (maltosyl-transferring)